MYDVRCTIDVPLPVIFQTVYRVFYEWCRGDVVGRGDVLPLWSLEVDWEMVPGRHIGPPLQR